MSDQAEVLRRLMQREGQQNSTEIVSVSSGKGGVGKTTLSVNLAIGYAAQGKKVVLLDADLGLANANILLNIIPEYDLYHLTKGQKTIEEIIIQTSYGIDLISGASGLSRLSNLAKDELNRIIENFSKLSYADIIIIDTSAGVHENVTSFIEASHQTIIVTTPEPTAITDAYGLIKIVSSHQSIASQTLHLVVNQASSVMQAQGVANRIIRIASHFLNVKINYLGFIYRDEHVAKAIHKQKPFTLYAPYCRASGCLEHLLRKFDKSIRNEKKDVRQFISRLLRR